MNIIKRELKANFKSLIIWSVVMGLLIVMMMSEFSAYYNKPEMADMLDALPDAMLKAFSMYGANLTTLSGFTTIASIYFYLILSIHAVILGSSIISKEERDKTAEFLYTLPVTRLKVISSKLIVGIINIMGLSTVTSLSIIIMGLRYGPDGPFYKFLALMMVGIFIIQMIFLSLGMCLSAIVKRYKKSGAYAVGILLFTYLVSIFVSLSDKISFLKYITPFKYFEASYILEHGKLELVYLIISLIIISSAIAGTYLFYPKRDLHL